MTRDIVVIRRRGSNYVMRGTRYIDRQTMRIAHQDGYGIDATVRERMHYYCEMRQHMPNRKECAIKDGQCIYCRDYQSGKIGPYGGMYQYPAIPIDVVWQPSGRGRMTGVAYFAVTSYSKCFTFWADGSVVEEECYRVWVEADSDSGISAGFYTRFRRKIYGARNYPL